MDYNEPTPDFNNNNMPPEQHGSNGYAIASLVLGILSIPFSCCYGAGIILGILGIIFGILSKRNNYGKFSGMAIAGIICSAIGIVVTVIMLILIVVGISTYGTSGYSEFFQQYMDQTSY